MDLTYVMEYRFRRAADGSVWTDTSYDRPYWDRYLSAFDRVTVVARALDGEPGTGWKRVDGERVRVAPLPHYLGAFEYCTRYREVESALRRALLPETAVVLRIPSNLCTSAARYLAGEGRPFGVEVVGDAHAALRRGVTAHPLRPALQWWFARNQKKQCQTAVTAAYVGRSLRHVYPPGPRTVYRDCSDVTLGPEWFGEVRRAGNGGRLKLITVATLSQMYKGIDVLLRAVKICADGGTALELVIVGDGRHRESLERLTGELDLGGCVRFAGILLAGAPIREELDAADLFVLPSRTEGTPRALLEAMARGLPAIASNVGGIPDLLPATDLVPAGDAAALARRIREVCIAPPARALMSARNRRTAEAYSTAALAVPWLELQRELRDRSRDLLSPARNRGRSKAA